MLGLADEDIRTVLHVFKKLSRGMEDKGFLKDSNWTRDENECKVWKSGNGPYHEHHEYCKSFQKDLDLS